MAILERLFGRERSTPDPTNILGGMVRIGGSYYNARWNFPRVLNHVYGNPTGYACVNTIVNDFSRPDWMITTKKEPDKVDESTQGKSLKAILDEPSDMASGTQMQRDIAMDLELNGRSIWLQLRGKDKFGSAGPLTGFKRLACENLTVITNNERDLVGFIQTTDDGVRVPLLPSDVIYLHYSHPQNRWEGFPPAYVAGLPAEVDQHAKQFNWRLMENDGALPGYITVEGLNPSQFKEFKALWEADADPGKTRFLGGGGKAQYVKVGSSNRDMMYDTLREMSQADIAISFGMSPLVLNPTDATFANGDQARIKYVKTKCGAMWAMVSDQFTRQIQDDFPGQRIDFDLTTIDELNEAIDEKVTRAISLFESELISDDEARDIIGYGPKAEAKGEFMTKPSPVALNQAPDPEGKDPKPIPPEDQQQAAKSATKELVVQTEPDLPPGIKTQADLAAHEAYNAKLAPYQRAAALKMQRFYDRQSKAISARILSRRGKAITKALDGWWDQDRWDNELSDDADTLYQDTLTTFGIWTLSNLGSQDTFNADSTEIKTFVTQRAKAQAQLVNEHTFEQITAKLAALDPDTVTVDEIAAAVTKFFDETATTRANVWGNYEVASAATFGSIQAAKQGDYTGKYWIGGECPICLDNAAAGVIGIDDDFGTSDPPIHPGCVCCLGYSTQLDGTQD